MGEVVVQFCTTCYRAFDAEKPRRGTIAEVCQECSRKRDAAAKQRWHARDRARRGLVA